MIWKENDSKVSISTLGSRYSRTVTIRIHYKINRGYTKQFEKLVVFKSPKIREYFKIDEMNA